MPKTVTTFSLRAVVRQVIADGYIGPRAISLEVLSRVPSRHLRAALGQALNEYVRDVLSTDRPSPTTGALPGPTSRGRTPAPPPPVRRTPARSRFRDTVWQRNLNSQFSINEQNEYKMLRDMTRDDFLFVSADRHKRGDDMHAAGRRYDLYARLLTEHNVTTFGDLPTEVQCQHLTGVTFEQV